MEKSPYYDDWCQAIEKMSPEQLQKVIETGADRNPQYLELVKERLKALENGTAEWRPEVSDEVLNQSESVNVQSNEVSYGAESTLEILSYVVLVCGVICLIGAFADDSTAPFYIAAFISSLIFWAAMRVLANISRSLKDIKSILKKK